MNIDWYDYKNYFDLHTKEKINEKCRFLIYDNHDNHISEEFIYHCYDNNIAIFLLLPHFFHLIQLLNVDVFSFLKATMKSQFNTIFQTGIACLQKSKWIEDYIIARDTDMTKKNILQIKEVSTFNQLILFAFSLNFRNQISLLHHHFSIYQQLSSF